MLLEGLLNLLYLRFELFGPLLLGTLIFLVSIIQDDLVELSNLLISLLNLFVQDLLLPLHVLHLSLIALAHLVPVAQIDGFEDFGL